MAARLAQLPLYTIADNCFADFFGNGKADAAVPLPVGGVVQHKIFVLHHFAPLIGSFEVQSFAEPIGFFQHMPNSFGHFFLVPNRSVGFAARQAAATKPDRQDLGRQYFATFGAAAAQHIAAVFGSHTSAETVHFFVYSSFRLISSFHFDESPFIKLILLI